MSQNTPLDYGDLALEPFFDAVQEMLSGGAPSLNLIVTSATTIQAPGAVGDAQSALSIDGQYRFMTSNVAATHPGGVAGVYDIWATAADKDYSGATPNVDLTVYDFGLAIRASSSPPVGFALTRKIGEVDWSGSAITGIRNLAGQRDDGAPITPTAPIAGITPMRARGHASQTAPLATFEDSAGGVLASITPTGGAALSDALAVTRGAASSTALQALVSGDAAARVLMRADGKVTWGDGTGVGDVSFDRSGAGALRVTGALAVTGALTPGSVTSSGAIDGASFKQGGVALASTHLSDGATIAHLNSPAFSGDPTVPTAPALDDDLSIANTAWVRARLAELSFSPTGPAGGDLSGSYPNPTVLKSSVATFTVVNKLLAQGDLAHTGTKIGFFGATTASQVAARTLTNWSSASNSLRTINRNGFTELDLFDFVMTVVNDLKTYGVFA